jgi:hypothetical protein
VGYSASGADNGRCCKRQYITVHSESPSFYFKRFDVI